MQELDRYEIQGELGRGAVGSVFAARERASGRRVAIKLLHQADEERVERFLREAQVTAALDHPGIVRVHACEVAGDRPYLVLELVEGARPLDEVFPELERSERVALVRDAARALGHAHQRGVVHRDVKPANVLVDAAGHVRVTDFGLAWARELERLTRTGALLGTPLFMAPEQIGAKRDQIGPPTDVWALGVVLYQALTGRMPFEAPSLAELAVRIASANLPRPREVAPDVSRELEAVCLKALEREPSDRYRDGTALADDLDNSLSGSSVVASGLRRQNRRRWRLLALPALALGLAVTIALQDRAPTVDPMPTSAVTPTPTPAPTPTSAPPRARELGRVPVRIVKILVPPPGAGWVRARFAGRDRLLTYGTSSGLCSWDLTGTPEIKRRWPSAIGNVLVLGPSGDRFFVAATTRSMVFAGRLDQAAKPRTHLMRVEGELLPIGDLDVSPIGSKLVLAVGAVRLHAAPKEVPLQVGLFELVPSKTYPRVVRRFPDQVGGVRFVRFSHDGRLVTIASMPIDRVRLLTRPESPGAQGCFLRSYRVSDGVLVAEHSLPSRPFRLAVHPSRAAVAVSLRTSIGLLHRVGRLWLCDASGPGILGRYHGAGALRSLPAELTATLSAEIDSQVPLAHRHSAQGLVFSPDGRWLISLSGETAKAERAGAVAELRIWETDHPDAEYRRAFMFERGLSVASLAVSPDARRLAIGIRRGSVLLLRLD